MASNVSTMGLSIAKAGWLYRRSTILHRWKKNWFVLDMQGDLRYFESPESPRAEERIVVRAHVMSVTAGADCRRLDPPEGLNITLCGFIELNMRDRDNMVLCADSYDDMKAWQIALEEARTVAMNNPLPTTYVTAPPTYVSYAHPYSPYQTGPFFGGYHGQVISTGQVLSTTPATQQVIQTSSGTTILAGAPTQQMIVVDDDPYRYRHLYGYRRRTNLWW